MEKLDIGRVYTNQYGETEIDDYGWSPEMDEVEEGYQFIFGKINVFVGMVNTLEIGRASCRERVCQYV